MSTESLPIEATLATPPAGAKRSRPSNDEVDAALRVAGGHYKAAAAGLKMSYMAVYLRVRRSPVLLAKWGNEKLIKAILKKAPMDLGAPRETRRRTELGLRGLGVNGRARELMTLHEAQGGIYVLPAIGLCQAGAYFSYAHVLARFEQVAAELRNNGTPDGAKLGWKRQRVLHKQFMALADLIQKFIKATMDGAKFHREHPHAGKATRAA